MSRDPIFEVTSAAADAAARRLTTAAKVQAVLFGGTATDTALLETMIDRVSARAARHCNLAKDAIGTPPTFGRETCRATWSADHCGREIELFLPWRVPIASFTSVVEEGVTLSAAGYRLRGGAILERMDGDAPVPWSSGKIVVTYVTGWQLENEDQVPPDLEAAVIDQVKVMYQTRMRDLTLRSEQVPDVYAATYSVAGGDSIDSSGLLVHVEVALADYRALAAL
jgi:hypothetical protein